MYPDNDSLHFIVEVMDEHFPQRKKSDVEDDKQNWADDTFFSDEQQDDAIIQDDQHAHIIPQTDDPINQDENLESNEVTDGAKSSTKVLVAKNTQDVIPSFSLGIEDSEDLTNATVENNSFFTPQPPERKKSSRDKKVCPYGKSPFINKVIDIKTKQTWDCGSSWGKKKICWKWYTVGKVLKLLRSIFKL
ncbi:hypothetical protein ACET3Z_029908 [Daucus carota]